MIDVIDFINTIMKKKKISRTGLCRKINRIEEKAAYQAIKYDSDLILNEINDPVLDEENRREVFANAIFMLGNPENQMSDTLVSQLPPSLRIKRQLTL